MAGKLPKLVMAPEGVSWANLANAENNARRGTRRAALNWRRGPVRYAPEEGNVMTWQRGGPLEGRRVIYTRKAVTSPGGTTRMGSWVPVIDEAGDYGGPYANAVDLIRGDYAGRYAANIEDIDRLRRAQMRERDPRLPTREQDKLISNARDRIEMLAARGRLRPAVMRGKPSPPPSRNRSRSPGRVVGMPSRRGAAGRNRSRSRGRGGRSRSRNRGGRSGAAGGESRRNRGGDRHRSRSRSRGRGGAGGAGGR